MENEVKKYSEYSLPEKTDERKSLLENFLGKEIIVFYTGYGPKYAEDNESRPSFDAYMSGKIASIKNHRIWENPMISFEDGDWIYLSSLQKRILVEESRD